MIEKSEYRMAIFGSVVVFVIATLVVLFARLALMRMSAQANRDDCEEAGHRLHGQATLQVMPDGVHDLCFVQTEHGQVVVPMR